MEIQTFSEEEKEEIIRYGLDKIKNSCMMSAVTLLMGDRGLFLTAGRGIPEICSFYDPISGHRL